MPFPDLIGGPLAPGGGARMGPAPGGGGGGARMAPGPGFARMGPGPGVALGPGQRMGSGLHPIRPNWGRRGGRGWGGGWSYPLYWWGYPLAAQDVCAVPRNAYLAWQQASQAGNTQLAAVLKTYFEAYLFASSCWAARNAYVAWQQAERAGAGAAAVDARLYLERALSASTYEAPYTSNWGW
jgi:hypothetical protein